MRLLDIDNRNRGIYFMALKKLLAGTALLTAALVSGCNLSTQLAANEVALNPPTLEVSPTSTLALTPLPTRTPIDAAPTLIALGGGDVTNQPVSLTLNGTVIPPTQPPPQGICSAKPTGSFDVNIRMGAGTNFGIITALHAGQYVQVLNRSDVGWLRVNVDGYGQGWVSGKVVTLFGPCNGLPVEAVATISASVVAPSMTPTPTAMFGFTMNISLNRLITKEKIGDIPAGTTVVVTSTQFNGSFYLYGIVTADGRSATATDSQLAYSASGGLMPFPTPTPYVYVATPTAFFNGEIGMGQYRVVTVTQVEGIPAGTTVRIGSAYYDGTTWMYDISTANGQHATASQSQLAYAPNAGGGGPTPTSPVVATATVPVMDLPTDVSPSDVVIPDGMCTVTAKSKTNLYASPNTSASVVGVMNPGPWAQVGASNGQGWYKVTIWTDGRQGWGNISTLTLHGPCDSLPTEGGG
jgi:uncharacterized protein YgiM (DUF1202 family)